MEKKFQGQFRTWISSCRPSTPGRAPPRRPGGPPQLQPPAWFDHHLSGLQQKCKRQRQTNLPRMFQHDTPVQKRLNKEERKCYSVQAMLWWVSTSALRMVKAKVNGRYGSFMTLHQPVGLWTMLTWCQDAGSPAPLIPLFESWVHTDFLPPSVVKGPYLSLKYDSAPQMLLTGPPSLPRRILQTRRLLRLTLLSHSHILKYWNQI